MGVSGASTHMMRGEVGAPPCLAAWGLLAAPPLMNRGHEPLLTHALVPPPFSPPAAPFHGRSLGEALTVGFFAAPRRRAAGFPGDPLLPLPRWIEGTEVIIELNV